MTPKPLAKKNPKFGKDFWYGKVNSPVESVSQPKAVDGYLKEFDEFLENHGNFMGGIGSNMIFKLKSFFSYSIERARREGGVEAIEMVVDEEMMDDWQRNVYLKMWRDKHDKE